MADELNLEAERAAFEAWAKPYGLVCDFIAGNSGDKYILDETVVAWESWLAARRAAPIAAQLDAEGLSRLPKLYEGRYSIAELEALVRQAQRDAIKADGRIRGVGAHPKSVETRMDTSSEAGGSNLHAQPTRSIDTPEFSALMDKYDDEASYGSLKNARAALIAYIDGRTAGTAGDVVPGHLREFVEQVAGPCFNYIDRETDETCCNGCNLPHRFVSIDADSQEQHADNCIVLRARAMLAAAPSPQSPAGGEGQAK